MVQTPVFHNRVRVIDIDGTVFKRRSSGNDFQYEPETLPGCIEVINGWFDAGDYICFWTGRPSEYREVTRRQLDSVGFKYHELLMDKPITKNMIIYDDNPIIVVKLDENKGVPPDARIELNGISVWFPGGQKIVGTLELPEES
jgi:hypothetical protein